MRGRCCWESVCPLSYLLSMLRKLLRASRNLMSAGKQLEELVAFVEEQMVLPQGLKVEVNKRLFDETGVQIAEFDIFVAGKVGTTDFSWLIECRDRPSEGPAPTAWVEQLAGRRARFNLAKVTAVSTTGFAKPAIEYAAQAGVELREVRALEKDQFSDWLQIAAMIRSENQIELRGTTLLFSAEDIERHTDVLTAAVEDPLKPVLRPLSAEQPVPSHDVFGAAIESRGGVFDDVIPNGPDKEVRIRANYPNPADHFVVDTSEGPIRVQSILFNGVVRKLEKLLPIKTIAEYRHANQVTISQFAAFEPMELHGATVAVEFHRIPASEEAYVVVRTKPQKP